MQEDKGIPQEMKPRMVLPDAQVESGHILLANTLCYSAPEHEKGISYLSINKQLKKQKLKHELLFG